MCNVEHVAGWRDIKEHTNFISSDAKSCIKESIWLNKSVFFFFGWGGRKFWCRKYLGCNILGSCIFWGMQLMKLRRTSLPPSCILRVSLVCYGSEIRLETMQTPGTLKCCASKVFNSLPASLRSWNNVHEFDRLVNTY